MDIENNVYLQDSVYSEHYVYELRDSSTGVQTDLALGVELLTRSLDSLLEIPEDDNLECIEETELPWNTIALLQPGTYTLMTTRTRVRVIHIYLFELLYSIFLEGAR